MASNETVLNINIKQSIFHVNENYFITKILSVIKLMKEFVNNVKLNIKINSIINRQLNFIIDSCKNQSIIISQFNLIDSLKFNSKELFNYIKLKYQLININDDSKLIDIINKNNTISLKFKQSLLKMAVILDNYIDEKNETFCLRLLNLTVTLCESYKQLKINKPLHFEYHNNLKTDINQFIENMTTYLSNSINYIQSQIDDLIIYQNSEYNYIS